MSLPPLPTIPRLRNGHVQIRDFTLLEMQEYAKSHGQQCREAALEEAAIDAERNGHLWSGKPAQAFFELAEQIRSLK